MTLTGRRPKIGALLWDKRPSRGRRFKGVLGHPSQDETPYFLHWCFGQRG
jgi:hypothetical protein